MGDQDAHHFDHIKDVYAALQSDGVVATEATTFDGQERIVVALEIELERRGLSPHLTQASYRIECEVCGERGTVNLSIEPQHALAATPGGEGEG